jgi:hypothetical protein
MREKSITYAYQDTDFFPWGFCYAPQTFEIADPAMIRSLKESSRFKQLRLTCEWDD